MVKKKIVFVTYGGGHVNMLVPVIKRLQGNPNLELLVLGLTTAGSVLEKNNIPHIGFKDLVGNGDQYALAWGRKLFDSATSHESVSYEESVAYMGLSYVDLELRHNADDAAWIYKNQCGRQSFYPLTVMERFLKSEKPDLVVATSAPRAERATIATAGNLGIRSICLVDLFSFAGMKWLGQEGFSNKICVISDYVKQNFVTAGRNVADVIVTGNPAFDSMADLFDFGVRAKYRAGKGWSDEDIVVLWAFNAEPEQHPYSDKIGDPLLPRKVEAQLYKLAETYPNIRVIFRPHPNDNTTSYGALPDRVEISLAKKDDLGNVLISSDCVIVMASTVGYQAALLGKPLVNVRLSIFSDGAPYDKMGMSVGVDDLTRLPHAVLQALSDGQQAKGLPKVGDATDNVVNVIEELL